MLRIRSSQMRALSRPLLEPFLDRAMVVVRRHWAHKVERMGDDAARALLHRSVLHAAGSGLHHEQQLLRYVNVVLALGEPFPGDHAWAARLLDDPRLVPDMKVALLAERTAAHLDGELVD